MVDSADKVMEKAAERKARRASKNTKDMKKSADYAKRGEQLPVMTQADQRRKMHELKARFLNSSRLEPFVAKLFDMAMDDEHQGQVAAMKLIADRILPATAFSGEDKKSSAVQINITGLQVSSIEEKPVADVNGQDVVSIQ